MRAVDALRSRGVGSGLLVHTHQGQAVPGFLEPYIEGVVRCDRPIEELGGRIDELLAGYGRVVSAMHERTGEPVVAVPCLHGDCFGALAGLTSSMPGVVRPVAWIHADNRYDLTVAAHYERAAYAFGCVSRELEHQTAARLAHRVADIFRVPNPVGVLDERVHDFCGEPRAIRLVYTGRLDEHQKRVSALPWIARRLDGLGIDYQLRIVGDGDSFDALRTETASMGSVELLGSVDPDEVAGHLRWADLWVLPSRYEGQSVAMLEAMASGCVPIVARVRSGMSESIVNGRSGIIVEVDEDATGEQAGRAMAEVISRAKSMDLSAMGERARDHIVREHDPARFGDRLVSIVEHVRAMAVRAWPSESPAAFTGSTPPDAADRMHQVLGALAGKRIALYGAGRHTAELLEIIDGSPCEIVCVIDDEPARWGKAIARWPVVSLEEAAHAGIMDVVISSWMHEERLAERTLKRMAFARVHRLYGGVSTRGSTPEPA